STSSPASSRRTSTRPVVRSATPRRYTTSLRRWRLLRTRPPRWCPHEPGVERKSRFRNNEGQTLVLRGTPVSTPSTVRLTIDAIEVEVPKGTGLVEAALAAGIEIPRSEEHTS